MNTPPVDRPASESRWMGFLRSFIAFVLALALTVISALLVMSVTLHFAAEPVFRFQSETVRGAIMFLVLLVVLLPVIGLFIAVRRRWISWRGLLVGWGLTLPVLLWLAWDDATVRRPLSLAQLSPVLSGDEQSYALLMQYSKGHPSVEATAFIASEPMKNLLGANIKDTAEWHACVKAHRDEIEAAWVALAPQRRWLGELNAFGRIGDITPATFDADIMRFDIWRTLSQRVRAKATLLALDGQGDEAMATLLPLLETSRKLQASARTLVRLMIAVTVERTALETASQVLDCTEVSAETRARLGEALQNENARQMGRRLVLFEYAFFEPVVSSLKLGDALALSQGGGRLLVRRPLNFLSALFINPNATVNLYGSNIFALSELAGARELEKFSVQAKAFATSLEREGGMKNLGGRLMVASTMPNYDKVLESYWKGVDQREALRVKVNAAP